MACTGRGSSTQNSRPLLALLCGEALIGIAYWSPALGALGKPKHAILVLISTDALLPSID